MPGGGAQRIKLLLLQRKKTKGSPQEGIQTLAKVATWMLDEASESLCLSTSPGHQAWGAKEAGAERTSLRIPLGAHRRGRHQAAPPSMSVLAHSSCWHPCPIPSSAVFSFTLHEFYSQSINKPIMIRVLYSYHISSPVINHFRQESGSFSISHSSLFLSQWLRETNQKRKSKNAAFAQ